jgi:4-amino-4-deoxy-L-arabinose transferase-like glycosyltransferase
MALTTRMRARVHAPMASFVPAYGAARPVAPPASRSRLALTAIWCLFAGQLAFACVLVPPWQNPDEPVYFAVIRALAKYPSIELSRRGDPSVQSEVLASMAEHSFWRAYEQPVPQPFPRRFADVSEYMGDASAVPEVLYYIVASRYCRWLGVTTVLGQYYALRIATALISLLTFALVLQASREWFDEHVALVTAAIVACVPQFGLMSIAVSPDPVVFFAANFVWWQAARLSASRQTVVPILLMLAAAAAAVLTKHLATPLLAQALLLAVFGTATTTKRRALLGIGTLAILAGVAGAALILSGRTFEGLLAIAVRDVKDVSWTDAGLPPGMGPFSLGYLLQFTWTMISTAYLAAGWLRFFPPAFIAAAAAVFCAIAFVRGCIGSVRSDDRRIRLGFLFSALFVAIQLASVYGTKYYLPGYTTQGRFFFPAIGPFAVICALGLVRWMPAAKRTAACCGTVGVLGALSLAAWAITVVPVYARW